MHKLILATCLILSAHSSFCLDPAMAVLILEQKTQQQISIEDPEKKESAVVALVKAKLKEFKTLISKAFEKQESSEKN